MLGGCVVNPVTGEREVRLVSDQSANAMGAEQYGPAQQMQGGLLRVDQDLQAYVTRVGNRLAVASGVNLPYEFVVLNNSSLNAWALPGGKIAVNRGLLMSLRNEAELAAVLAHEVVHAAAGHGVQRYQRGLLTEGLLSAAAIGLDIRGLQGGNQVVGAAQQGAQLIGLKYSRDVEREADYYGADFMVKAGYDPYAAVTLQEQFLALSNGQGQTGVGSWFASHPTSAERLQNNRIRARELRGQIGQGRFAQAEYEQATRLLRSRADAYEDYDEAVVLAQEQAFGAASAAVGRALSMVDAEAKFHGLRGMIRFKQGNLKDALTNLNRAIERDPNYFQYYLVRGRIFQAMGDGGRAKTDLSKSMLLLPTSAAKVGFVSLDIADNPARYVRITSSVNEAGSVVQIVNRAGIDLANVLMQLEIEEAGQRRQQTINLARLGAQQPVVRQVSGTVRQAYAVSAQVHTK